MFRSCLVIINIFIQILNLYCQSLNGFSLHLFQVVRKFSTLNEVMEVLSVMSVFQDAGSIGFKLS